MYVTVQTFCFQALISGMSRVSWEYTPFCEIHTTPTCPGLLHCCQWSSLRCSQDAQLFPSRLLSHGSWSVVSFVWGRDSSLIFLSTDLSHMQWKVELDPWGTYIEKKQRPLQHQLYVGLKTHSVYTGNQSRFLNVCFWLRWVFVSACWLFLVGMSWGHPSLGYASFWLQWLLLLWSPGSRAQA